MHQNTLQFALFYAPTCIQVCTSQYIKIKGGVPVYLAPWTACPPGGKPTAVGLYPEWQAVSGYLAPHPGYLHPRGQAVQGGKINCYSCTSQCIKIHLGLYSSIHQNTLGFALFNKYIKITVCTSQCIKMHRFALLITSKCTQACTSQYIKIHSDLYFSMHQ